MTRNDCHTPDSFSDWDVERPSFDTCNDMIKATVVEATQNHKQAKANVCATDHVILTVY